MIVKTMSYDGANFFDMINFAVAEGRMELHVSLSQQLAKHHAKDAADKIKGAPLGSVVLPDDTDAPVGSLGPGSPRSPTTAVARRQPKKNRANEIKARYHDLLPDSLIVGLNSGLKPLRSLFKGPLTLRLLMQQMVERTEAINKPIVKFATVERIAFGDDTTPDALDVIRKAGLEKMTDTEIYQGNIMLNTEEIQAFFVCPNCDPEINIRSAYMPQAIQWPANNVLPDGQTVEDWADMRREVPSIATIDDFVSTFRDRYKKEKQAPSTHQKRKLRNDDN